MRFRMIFAGLVGASSAVVGATAPPSPSTPEWAAPSTARSRAEAVRFKGPDGAVLQGTLLLPVRAAPMPAVIVFHGASSPSRDERLYDHLKQMLPALGIAVLTYDRRGTGASAGRPAGNGFDLLADDGIAAAKALASDPRIDPRRIGFWGLSQGGWLALLAASRWPGTAFAISVSAPMVPPDVQMNFAVANILRIKGHSQADIRLALSARTAVDEFERGRLDRQTAQRRVDEAARHTWFPLIYLDRTFRDPATSGWAKELRHDPLSSLSGVRVPALILYGAADPWIPVGISVERLAKATRGHPAMTVAVISGADHAMMLDTPAERQIDPGFFPQQAPDAPEYFARLAAWLRMQRLADWPTAPGEHR